MSDVRITVDVYGRPFGDGGDAERFGVTMNNEPLRVDVDLWRCERCAALTLQADSARHTAACGELMAGADEDALSSVEALRLKLMSLDGGQGTWVLHHLALIERALRARFDA